MALHSFVSDSQVKNTAKCNSTHKIFYHPVLSANPHRLDFGPQSYKASVTLQTATSLDFVLYSYILSLMHKANPVICNQHTVLCFTHNIDFQKEFRFWSESQPEACPEQYNLGILRSLSLVSWNQFWTQLLKGNVVGFWHAYRYRAWNVGLEIWSQKKKPEQQSWN